MGKEKMISEGKIKDVAFLIPCDALDVTKKLWNSDKCQDGMPIFTKFEAN